jgi:hypothetical protein
MTRVLQGSVLPNSADHPLAQPQYQGKSDEKTNLLKLSRMKGNRRNRKALAV